MKTSLLNLAAPTPRPWYAIRAEAGEDTTEVMIYGTIGESWWEESVSAGEFRREFAAITTARIDVHVHSLGGSVWDGLAIANTIRQSKATVIVTVDGLAASAASWIAIAGDELVMSPGSELMIHDGMLVAAGNPADLREIADWLDRECDNIATLYQAKAGGDVAAWRAAMKAETWYTAEEAVQAGLADRVDGNQPAAATRNRLDLTIFNFAGRAAAPAPAFHPIAHQLPAPPGDLSITHQKEDDPMADLIAGLRERLGVKPDATLDDDGLLAALDEALQEQTNPTVAANHHPVPDGTVLLDQEQYNALRNDAAAGREARTQQIDERRSNLVAAAIDDGRIPPARRDHYLALLAADEEGTTTLLASLTPGTIPLEARGHTGGVAEATSDDQLYALAFPDEKKEG